MICCTCPRTWTFSSPTFPKRCSQFYKTFLVFRIISINIDIYHEILKVKRKTLILERINVTKNKADSSVTNIRVEILKMELNDSRMYFFVYQLYLNVKKKILTNSIRNICLSFSVVVTSISKNQMFLKFYLQLVLLKRPN